MCYQTWHLSLFNIKCVDEPNFENYSGVYLRFLIDAVVQKCSVKNYVLRIFGKLTGKYLRKSFFFNKVADLRPTALLKKRLWYRFLPVNFIKFLTTPFLQITSGGWFYRSEGLRKNKYISILHRSWGFYSITYLDHLLLCYANGRIFDYGIPHQIL